MWAFSDFWDYHGDLSGAILNQAFVDHYGLIFDASSTEASPGLPNAIGADLGLTSLGEGRDQVLRADKDVFCAAMERLLSPEKTVTRRLFFQALHIAYADAIGRECSPDPIILFGLHIPHPHRVRKFLDDFPDAMFLHMIREPSQSTASQFRQYELISNTPSGAMMVGLVNSLIGSVPVTASAAPCSRVVRLEDMHENPLRTILAVCGWLQIPFEASLLQSSYNGLKFWNEKGQPQISGISTEYVKQRYEEYVGSFDRFRIRRLCAPRHRDFGYYPNAFFAGSRVVQFCIAPLLILPFRMEWMEIIRCARSGRLSSALRAYFKLRRFFLKFLTNPPGHAVPLFGAPPW